MMFGFGILMMFLVFVLPVALIALVIGIVVWGLTKRPGITQVTAPGSAPIPAAPATAPNRSCSHCGAGLQAGWTHCPQCGAPVDSVA